MSAAKGRKLVQVLAALAVLAAVALPAGASIPQPGVQLPEPNSAALLAAARDASSPAIKAARDRGFELFSAPLGDRFRLDLHAAVDAPAQARFHLLTPRKSRIRGVNVPEPLLIEVELPPSRTAFRLYGDVPYGFASGGLYITTDPLGYVDGPNLYQYGLNNPVSFSDPMGLAVAASEERFEENGEKRLQVQIAIEQAAMSTGYQLEGEVVAALVDSILAYGLPKNHEEMMAALEESLMSVGNPLALAPGKRVVAQEVGGGLRRFLRKLNPMRWFDDLGEATAHGLREGAEEGIEELTPRVVELPRGAAVLDANALIRGLEGGELAAVESALAGRTPTISITAAKEFLRKGDVGVLREFLVARGGRLGQAATAEQIQALQTQARVIGRALRAKDAAVVGSAVREGAPLITRDQRLLRFLQEVGIPAESF